MEVGTCLVLHLHLKDADKGEIVEKVQMNDVLTHFLGINLLDFNIKNSVHLLDFCRGSSIFLQDIFARYFRLLFFACKFRILISINNRDKMNKNFPHNTNL